MNHSQAHEHVCEQATARRLAQLGERDVDTSAIEQRLAVEFESWNVSASPEHPRRTPWLKPALGVVAACALAATLFVFTFTSTRPVSADVIDLATLHHEMVAGHLAITPAQTIEDINRQIAAGNVAASPVYGGARVQSCCLTDVQGDLVAAALLNDNGVLITVVIAEAPAFAHPMGEPFEIRGQRFWGHTLNDIPMMMGNQGDKWLCVMGDRPNSALAAIAAQISY